MKRDELKRQVEGTFRQFGNNYLTPYELRVRILELLDQLDEPEVLSWEWIEENSTLGQFATSEVINFDKFVKADKLQNLLVPKQKEVDRAYKDGYEKGKEYTFYKGYLEGLADKESESETVADVITDFYKSVERLKEVLGTEVKELEE